MSEKTPAGPDELEQLGFGAGFSEELAGMLEMTAMFGKFERSELRLLADYCGAYRMPAGHTLFHEGDKSHFMAVLLKGRIDILKQGKLITTIRPGRALGEMSMVDGHPHSATARAVEEAEIVLLSHTQYASLCDDHPRLALKLLKTLAGLISLRLRQTTGILLDHL